MAIRRSIASVYRGGQSYIFSTDRRGRPALPTLATMERAGTAGDKLALAGQLADVIQIQVDTAVRAGSTGRLADLVFRSGQLLDALDDVIDGLTGKSEPAAATAAMKRYHLPLTGVLTTLRETLGLIATLAPMADEAVAARTAFRLRQLDIQTSTLAARGGLSWKTFLMAGSGLGFPIASAYADDLDVVA